MEDRFHRRVSGLGIPITDEQWDPNIEEERRLFYVAITRAKTHLHFVTSMSDIPVSRFVESILSHLKINRFTNKLKTNIPLKDICEKPFVNQKDNLEHYQRHYCATDYD